MSPVAQTNKLVWQSAISSFTNSISRSSNPCVLFIFNTSLSVGIIGIYTVRYSDSDDLISSLMVKMTLNVMPFALVLRKNILDLIISHAAGFHLFNY